MSGWFEVDKKGLAQLLERRGKGFVVTELIQNAWDENVKDVSVSFSKRTSDKKWVLSIIDDSPEGFSDLRDAFTLFAPSKKKGDAEKRGRFNLGEKLVLALASEAIITTTTGQIVFDKDGRHLHPRKKRPTGTSVQLVFDKFKNDDVIEALDLCRRLIPPTGVSTYITSSDVEPLGRASFYIEPRTPVASFEVTLPTEISNGEGTLVRSARKTIVNVYEADGVRFPPAIYEIGIPVVETDDLFVIDVQQKVPLNLERDNVTPAYLRALRTHVANETAHLLSAEDTTSTWVAEALADERIAPEVVQTIVKERYGKKVVAFDPSDPEANKIATSEGYTVLGGRSFSKEQWANLRKAEVIKPAGQVTPSAQILTSPDGIPPLPEEEWTDAHRRIAKYAQRVHRYLIRSSGDGGPVNVVVQFQHKRTAGSTHSAWYSRGRLNININVLGKAWLTEVTQESLDALLIHEYGHYYSADHLSAEYYRALCTLGARLRVKSKAIGEL